MEFRINGSVTVKPEGYGKVTAELDIELVDLLSQIPTKEIFDCLDVDEVAEFFGLVKPE
jgi:hypothetical protein